MVLRSPIGPRTGALLLLSCSVISAAAALELDRQRRAEAASAAADGDKLVQRRQLVARLQSELAAVGQVGSGAWRAPEPQLADVLGRLRSHSAADVRWRQISVGAQATATQAAEIRTDASGRRFDTLFAACKFDPRLRQARLEAQGEYQSLAGVLNLLDDLRLHGVAISGLQLQEHQLSLRLRVLGRA